MPANCGRRQPARPSLPPPPTSSNPSCWGSSSLCRLSRARKPCRRPCSHHGRPIARRPGKPAQTASRARRILPVLPRPSPARPRPSPPSAPPLRWLDRRLDRRAAQAPPLRAPWLRRAPDRPPRWGATRRQGREALRTARNRPIRATAPCGRLRDRRKRAGQQERECSPHPLSPATSLAAKTRRRPRLAATVPPPSTSSTRRHRPPRASHCSGQHH